MDVHISDGSEHPFGSTNADETSLRLGSSMELKTYTRRWYVLIVFSLVGLTESAIWNCYGPVAQSVKEVFGWSDATIAMFANWGNIVYILFMIPVAWIMDVKGLRIAMVLSSTLLALGAGIKCITIEPVAVTWLANIGSILNGIAGTVPYAAPALLSATWFPPKQRATATAISTVFGYMGLSVSFIIGPLIVPEPTSSTSNWTYLIPINESNLMTNDTRNLTLAKDITPQRDGIMRLMYIEGGVTAILWVMVICYFPAKPPTPPSVTASIDRTSYFEGLKGLVKHKRFILILLAYCIPTGVLGGFSAVLDVNLKHIDISQVDAGWIGFYSTTAGCLAALLMSRIADIFLRHMKVILLIMFLGATVSIVWFILLRLSYIHFSLVSVYASCIIMGLFINGSVPLFYELGCEASYPIAEGVTGGVLTLMNNFTGVILLTVLQIPNIGTVWMNWAMLGSSAAAIPLLLMFKEHYTRTDIDTQEIVVAPPIGGKTYVTGDQKSVNDVTIATSVSN